METPSWSVGLALWRLDLLESRDIPSVASAASKIIRGDLLALDGARELGALSRAVGPGFHELDTFIYAESEAEDRPNDAEFFIETVLREARKWAHGS